MLEKVRASAISSRTAGTEELTEAGRQEVLLKAGALQSAILNSANLAIITTDETGVIQLFNVGAERMLGYTAAEVVNKFTAAELADPQALSARAIALGRELTPTMTPGFEALVCKAARGIEDVYALTYMCKDGSRFPAMLSVTAVRNAQDGIIGYLLLCSDNRAHQQTDEAQHEADVVERLRAEDALRMSEKRYRTLFESIDEGFCLLEKIPATADTPLDFRYVDANPAFEVQSGMRDVIGKTLRQMLPNLDEEWFLTYDQVVRSGKSTRFERELVERQRVLELYAFRVGVEMHGCVAVIFRDISARKQAAEVVRQHADQLKTLIDEAPLGIHLLDADFRIRQANPIAVSAFGHIPQLIGRDFAEVMHILWPAPQAEEAIKLFRYTLATGEPCYIPEMIENRADRQTTEYYEWQINRIPLPDGRYGVVCYFRDISERVLAQQQIRESEERYRSLFHSIDEGFCVIEMIFDAQQAPIDWCFLEVNPSFEKQTGMSDIVGKRMREIAPDHEAYWFTTYGKVALTGEPVRFVNHAKALDERWFDLYAFRVGGQGSRKVAVLFTDITERKQFELDLKNAIAVAENANRAKSDFLSGMSHELRTPLNAILGFAQLIDSGTPPPSPSQKRSLDQILKGGWYLLDLINEILDLALIESGKVPLVCESVSLSQLTIECRAMIEPLAQARGIDLRFQQCETPLFVKADRTRVKQILLNLLSNAIKYNKPSGSVVVEYAFSPPHSIRICVRDTGAGLSTEQLAQLFQPFNRLGKAGTEEGTGIGLVVTKRLVELMGGLIDVESAPGVGSVFWVELPQADAPQTVEAKADAALLARPQLPSDAALRTLLYVEDNLPNMELVEQLIARRSDMRLLSAEDGACGIALARVHQPTVILMDVNLPGISGIQALKILREDALTAHIPVLAISANAMQHDIQKGLDAGFMFYLTKPIKVNAFMEALDQALEFSETG